MSTTSNPDFGAKTTADEAAAALTSNIAGKTVLITGVSAGSLGLEAAQAIAHQQPALLVLAGRSISKLRDSEAAIRKVTATASLKLLVVDLASFESIRKAAKEVDYPVDVLINNAAAVSEQFAETADGFELTFGANHLGPFLFTKLLLPRILESRDKRIGNLSSNAHFFGGINWADVTFGKGASYTSVAAYAQSKTATLLFTMALARRRKDLTVLAIHPGMILTPGATEFISMGSNKDLFNSDDKPMDPAMLKTVHEGASTHIVAAFDPLLKEASGSYLADCQLAPDQRAPHITEENADRLWDLTEKLIGEKLE